MMTNRMEGDEGAKTALETRNFMYFPFFHRYLWTITVKVQLY